MSHFSRFAPIHFFMYGLMGLCGSDAIRAADLQDPSSPHMSRIFSPCQMIEVLDLHTKVWEPGGTESIKTYLDEGKNPNLIDSTGQKTSLLEMFSYAGHETFVDTLLRDPRICVSYLDANGHNAFYQASVANKPYILTALITHVRTHGTDQDLKSLINTPDTRHLTALHIASAKGYERVTEILLQYGAQVDLADNQGRTALHLACYMGHEGIVRQLLLGFNAKVDAESSEGLTAKDFFKLGELNENLRRSRIIENMLTEAEGRIGIHAKIYKDGLREKFRRDESLNAFMTTFQRKCGAIFLAYRALESDVIQGAQDTFTVSNMIDILGNQIPLPGASLVTTVLSSGAAYIEDRIETGKKETLTHFFTTIRDMEDAVEQAAYDLTNHYEAKISQLTREGARTLALCGVGRFIEFMRESSEISKRVALSTLVLESIKQVKPKSILDRLPWSATLIETKDNQRWTERSVFEAVDHQLPDSLNTIIVTHPVDAQTTPPVELSIPKRDDVDPKNRVKSGGCCTLS